MKKIYLDHCATTPIRPEVLEEMLPFFRDRFGNPSSIHSHGRAAKEAVEKARAKVAALIGASPAEILFTSGGTESDNLAIRGTAEAFGQKGRHVVTCAIEHPAVLSTCRDLERVGISVTYLPVDSYGLVDPGAVKRAVSDETILVSIMHGNNEIGTIEPIEEIRKVMRKKGILFHTDAVQTVGKIPVAVEELNVDLLTFSSHKINGPKGIGALYVREGIKISPLLTGGHQEREMRGGTENVPAIVGFGKACEIAGKGLSSRMKTLSALRNLLQEKLLRVSPDLGVNGHPERRLPHILSVSIRGIPAEDIVKAMDQEGIAISAGSACTSRKVEISHVIEEIGLPSDLAQGTIRWSVGYGIDKKEIERASACFATVIGKLKALREMEDSLGGRRCL